MRSIDQMPRAPLGNFPTPLEEAPRLAAALGCAMLFVKRDDLTGLALGGNKVRKLEYVLGDALAQRADTMITAAGVQSNRARMTAAASRRAGLQCILLLCGNYGEKRPIGNLMLDEIFGADIRFTAAPDWYSPEALAEAQNIANDLRMDGRRAYVTETGNLPEPVAEVGYYVGTVELLAQCQAAGFEPASIVLPCGSGSQQAGVIVGLRASGVPTRVVGISTDPGATSRAARVRRRAAVLADWLELDLKLEEDDVIVDDRFSGAGHGPPDRASVEAVRLVARTEGLLIDPIYVGKVVAALPDLVRSGLVNPDQPTVVWHTGGTTGVFIYSQAFNQDPGREHAHHQ